MANNLSCCVICLTHQRGQHLELLSVLEAGRVESFQQPYGGFIIQIRRKWGIITSRVANYEGVRYE